ncbi:hypothetical protein E4U17_000055 [Claviceps sp. LM77 group G4]|nr:hypothetical protein E4U17_000055 [Claviceps sp. LM77 group G4]KAG6084499.1 hypothetical protein E4U16_001628 [Claviceps sp. LM84 group G4]KAG6086651.1 hypothetical protein E4U33_002327 [Claviceps sp. LM78 group G4]
MHLLFLFTLFILLTLGPSPSSCEKHEEVRTGGKKGRIPKDKYRPWATKKLPECAVPCMEELFNNVIGCSLDDKNCVCDPNNLDRASVSTMCFVDHCYVTQVAIMRKELRKKCALWAQQNEDEADGTL